MATEKAGPSHAERAGMLDALGFAVVASDMEGVITYWNAEAEALYGFRADEVVGRQIYYVLPAALADDDIDRMMKGFAAGHPWDGVLRIRRKDGEWIRTVHSDRVLKDENGRATTILSASLPASRVETAVAEEKTDVVTKDVVRSLLRSMRSDGPESARRTREMGKAIAVRANCPGTTVYLELFSKMGMGDLKLDDERPARIVFSGQNLLERAAHSPTPTCHLPLCFLEGAVATLTKRPTLGAETQCQSMGAPKCVFVVSAR